MAQPTTALCSGWVSDKILPVFRYNTFENANCIWRKLNGHYNNITDIRSLSLRDRAERYKQRQDQPIMDWIGGLNTRVSDLAASGYVCDDTYRKQLVRHNCNERFRPISLQLLLASPRSTYEEFMMSLLEVAADNDEPQRFNDRSYYSARG